MAKSNPDRFAEPTIIGTESEARQYVNRAGATQTAPKRESRTTKKFNAEEFLRQEEENSKAEAEQLRRTEILMNEYSLPWNVDDGKPPFPGMELNPCAVRWEPANLEDFIREYGEEFKRFKNAKLTNQSCNQSIPATANSYSKPFPKNISAIGLLNNKQHNDSPIPDKNAVPMDCLSIVAILLYA